MAKPDIPATIAAELEWLFLFLMEHGDGEALHSTLKLRQSIDRGIPGLLAQRARLAWDNAIPPMMNLTMEDRQRAGELFIALEGLGRGPGRPPKSPEERMVSQHVRFTPEDSGRIDAAAERTGVTRYQFIQDAANNAARAVCEN